MASIALSTVWLQSVADFTDSVSLTTMSKLTSAPQGAGVVRRYGSGRFRAVTQAGIGQQFSITALACSRAQIVWLEGHIGETLLVRDDRGRKFYGVYFNPSSDEHPYDDEGDVALTINEVTYTEAV